MGHSIIMKLSLVVLALTAVILVEAKHSQKLAKKHRRNDGEHEKKRTDGEKTPADITRLNKQSQIHGHTIHWKKPKSQHGGDKKKVEHWREMINYQHPPQGNEACSSLKCKKKEICLLNIQTKTAECLPKRLLKQKRKMRRGHKRTGKHEEKSKKSNGIDSDLHKKNMKEKAKKYQKEHRRKAKNKLHHIKPQVGKTKSNDKKATKDIQENMEKKSEPPYDKTVCKAADLEALGHRLLDLFKVKQSKQETAAHHMEKRNSKKKELHEDDECICQAPVSWEFLHIDRDADGHLDFDEVKAIDGHNMKSCIISFVKSCDHDGDSLLSEKEWCCCFADILPPCLDAQANVPSQLIGGSPVIMPGAFVPQCDDDGFYQSVQCHGSTGECWCADRNGVEQDGTRGRGTPTCGEVKEEESDTKIVRESANGV